MSPEADKPKEPEAEEAPAEGGSFLDEVLPKDRVPVVDADGKLGSVPAANYDAAVAKGYRFQTPQEQEKFHGQLKYGDSPIKAALAGAARGASLGLSDMALAGYGLAEKKTLEGLKEANPGASIAGDVVGTAASLVIPGAADVSGPGIVSKLGHAVEHGLAREGAGLLERVGAKALAGGVEGLTYGAMNAVNESYLGDTELNAQKLVAGAGLGGVLGVGAGGLGSLLGEGGSALKPFIKEQAESLADRYTLKAAGGIQSDIAKLSQEERPAIAQMLRSRGHIESGGSPAGVFKSVEKDLTGQSQQIGKELGLDVIENGHLSPLAPGEATADIVTPAKEAQGAVIGGVLKDADASGATFNFSAPRVRIREFRKGLNAAEERIAGRSIDNVMADLDAEYGKFNKLGGKGGFEAANDLKSTHYEDINWVGESKAKNNVMKQVAGIFNDEIEQQLKGVAGPEFFEKFMGAKRSFGMLTEAEKMANKGMSGKKIIDALMENAGHATDAAEQYGLLSKAYDMGLKGLNRMQGNRGASLTDYLAGNALSSVAGGPLGLVTGAAGMVGNKILRERGPAIIANLASRIAESPVLSTVAEHFAGAVAKSPEAFGAFAPELTSAAARSPEAALATHIELAKTHPDYKEAAALAGITFETGHAEAQAALDKAHALTGVKRALQGHDEKVGQLVEKALHKGGDVAVEHHAAATLRKQEFGTKQQRKDALAAHETHVRQVMELAGNPKALADRAAANVGALGQHAPAIGTAVTATSSRAVQFLASKAQRPPPGGPLAPEWHPSPAEVAKFSRYYAAVQDPTSVIKQAADGTLTPEALEAVKAVYPQWYQSVQGAVADCLTNKPKDVPYCQRVMLGLLSGMDVDGSLSPAAVQRSQAVYRGPSAKSAQDQAGMSGASKSGSAGAAHLTVSKRSMTPMQATASRGE